MPHVARPKDVLIVDGDPFRGATPGNVRSDYLRLTHTPVVLAGDSQLPIQAAPGHCHATNPSGQVFVRVPGNTSGEPWAELLENMREAARPWLGGRQHDFDFGPRGNRRFKHTHTFVLKVSVVPR